MGKDKGNTVVAPQPPKTQCGTGPSFPPVSQTRNSTSSKSTENKKRASVRKCWLATGGGKGWQRGRTQSSSTHPEPAPPFPQGSPHGDNRGRRGHVSICLFHTSEVVLFHHLKAKSIRNENEKYQKQNAETCRWTKPHSDRNLGFPYRGADT